MKDRLRLTNAPLVRPTVAVNGFELRRERDWSVLVDGSRAPGPGLGRPGLWRRDGARWTFDLPPLMPSDVTADGPHSPGEDAAAAGGPDDAGVRPPSAALLAWAEGTARGEAPATWQPPARAEVERWIGERRLTVGSGGRVVLGVLVCERDRLAFRFPHLVRVVLEGGERSALSPAVLKPARRAWLQSLCAAVQERWRLVRCELDAQGNVGAEVDLTGVPPSLAEPLVRLSLEALLCAVEWVLPSLHVVVDPSVASRVLDRRPPRA